MAYRLAIAISGAVSLGSYEAGVMFEIIRAISSHNSKVADNKQIKIDVLTGASAGGMTAVILAQKLLFEGNTLETPVTNHLYLPWVKVADVHGMLQIREDDDPDKSILSSGFIAGIAKNFLLDRYENGNAPQQIRHPAAAESIRLGLALSNLNGVDYGIEAFDGAELAEPGSKFIYTRFQDSMTRTVTYADDNKAFWEPVAKAARACGAFPFAFRPLHVHRDDKEVDYRGKPIQGVPFPEQAFTYTDGGVFNNSPLGMAKSLADERDTDPLDYERRFFLYVSPDRKGSSANLAINEEMASMLNTGKALINCIFQQGRFQDWVMTADYNESIEEFDDRAYRLRELLRGIPDSERDAMANVADRLLGHIYENRIKSRPSREQDFARLKQQFMVDPEAKTLLAEKGPHSVDAWIKSIQVLEQSGRIGDKDEMRVYTITASEDELAGEGMAAFAGFFDLRFREFDYTVGRKKARQFLQNLKEQAASGTGKRHLPLTEFTLPDDIPDVDPALGRATLADVDEQVRRALKERFSARIERLLKQFKLSVWLRKPLMWFFINRKLDDFLKLD